MELNPEDARQILSLGVGGVIAWLVIREMFAFLRHRKDANSLSDKEQLQNWHQYRDMERAIMQLVEVARQQSALLTQILHGQEVVKSHLSRISNKEDSDRLV